MCLRSPKAPPLRRYDILLFDPKIPQSEIVPSQRRNFRQQDGIVFLEPHSSSLMSVWARQVLPNAQEIVAESISGLAAGNSENLFCP
jgi:hypothetical protein